MQLKNHVLTSTSIESQVRQGHHIMADKGQIREASHLKFYQSPAEEATVKSLPSQSSPQSAWSRGWSNNSRQCSGCA